MPDGDIHLKITRVAILATLALVTGACQSTKAYKPHPVVAVEPPTKREVWMHIASAADTDRLQRIASAWTAGLADARAAGFTKEIKAEGELLQPGGALDRPAPTPGSYNCRQIKLGRYKRSEPAFEKFK